MTSYVTPKKNAAFVFCVGLADYATQGRLKSGPTIAAGDFKISKDGGAFANLTNLPSATGVSVQLSLTATEMNADNVTIACVDQTSTPEWCDTIINIQTTAAQMDDLATAANLSTAQTAITAIKAKTDNLPPDPADASDIAGAFTTLTSHGDASWGTVGASAIRSAVGLASANLDTQLAALASSSDMTTVVARLTDVWQIVGLDSSNPMTVTPTSRGAGSISQAISGDGTTTTTVTRS